MAFNPKKFIKKQVKHVGICELKTIEEKSHFTMLQGDFARLNGAIGNRKFLKRDPKFNVHLIASKFPAVTFYVKTELYIPFNAIREAAYLINFINPNLGFGCLQIRHSGNITFYCRYFMGSPHDKKILNMILKVIDDVFSEEGMRPFLDLYDKFTSPSSNHSSTTLAD